MLVKQVDLKDLKQAFEEMGRSDRFSDEALETLLDHYYDPDNLQEVSVITLCKTWKEVTLEEILDNYTIINVNAVDGGGYMVAGEPATWQEAYNATVKQLSDSTTTLEVEKYGYEDNTVLIS